MNSTPSAPRPRRTYHKPSVRTYPIFEQHSLACNKVTPPAGCPSGMMAVNGRS